MTIEKYTEIKTSYLALKEATEELEFLNKTKIQGIKVFGVTEEGQVNMVIVHADMLFKPILETIKTLKVKEVEQYQTQFDNL